MAIAPLNSCASSGAASVSASSARLEHRVAGQVADLFGDILDSHPAIPGTRAARPELSGHGAERPPISGKRS